MRLEPTETQSMLAHSAARLAMAGQDAAALSAQLDEAGFRGVTIPDVHGGFGGDLADAAVVLEEFGRGDVRDATVLNAVICAPALEAAGQDALLGEIIAGTRHVALALYEPGRGYATTPASVRLRDGALSGAKCAVIGGDTASDFLVSARGDDGAVRLVLVAAAANGVARRSHVMPDGRGAADLTLDDVRGQPLDPVAAAAIDAAADRGALAIAAEAQGVMAAALKITIEHLTTRQQFGRPLSKFQVLQARVADMAIAIQQARSGLLAALESPDPASVSAAKVLADNAALVVGEGAVQLHGAIGITEEHRIGQLFRRLTAGRSMFGDRRHHLARFSNLTTRETHP